MDNAYHVLMIHVIFTGMSLQSCYGPNLVRNLVSEILLSLGTIIHCNHFYTKFVSIKCESTYDIISTRPSYYLEANFTLLKYVEKLHFILDCNICFCKIAIL